MTDKIRKTAKRVGVAVDPGGQPHYARMWDGTRLQWRLYGTRLTLCALLLDGDERRGVGGEGTEYAEPTVNIGRWFVQIA